MTIRMLYLCYFGLREPLVQTQVLPYLRHLSRSGTTVYLLTFEPRFREQWRREEVSTERERLAEDGITWFHLKYHKTPSAIATAYDIVAGALFAIRLVRREKLQVLHARAHIPMAMALVAQLFTNIKLVFDLRALMAEEYCDAGIWAEGSLPFRFIKQVERRGLARADQVVVLTRRMGSWLTSNKLKDANQIEVIPCCVDLDRFRESATREKEMSKPSEKRFEVVYAGSLVGLYLVSEMGRFFKSIQARRPDAFLRLLSVSSPESAATALQRVGLNEGDFEILKVSPADIPSYLFRAQLALSFRKPAFAQIAASPTKIPEYLAAGLPVVCSAGVGDMDELIRREEIGVVLRAFDDVSIQAAALKALKLAENEQVRTRCRLVARAEFDLEEVGGHRYLNLYRRLSQPTVAVTNNAR